MKSLGKVQPEPPGFNGIVELNGTNSGDKDVNPANAPHEKASASSLPENKWFVPDNKPIQDRYHPVDDEKNIIFPREIGLGIKVESILSVDSAGSKFTATIKLSYEWQLTKEEHDSFLEHGDDPHKTWRPAWEPRVTFPNAEKVEVKEELMVPSSSNHKLFDTFEYKDKVYVVVYVRVRAIFSEVYELQNFPFDCQDLTIHLEAHDASRVLLQPRFKRDEFASIDLEHFTLAEWELFPPVASFLSKASSKGRSGNCKSSEFFFLVKLKRRYQYYVSRIMLLAGMLTFGSLLSWSIDVQLPHRLMVAFTILLTLVAFQMACSSKLPQIPYFTILDVYLVYSQRFMWIIALEHATLKRWLQDREYLEVSLDDWFLYSSCVLWAAFQLFFVCLCAHKTRLEEEKLRLNRQQLLVWLDAHGQGHNSDSEFKICKSKGVTETEGEKNNTTFRDDSFYNEPRLRKKKKQDASDAYISRGSLM